MAGPGRGGLDRAGGEGGGSGGAGGAGPSLTGSGGSRRVPAPRGAERTAPAALRMRGAARRRLGRALGNGGSRCAPGNRGNRGAGATGVRWGNWDRGELGRLVRTGDLACAGGPGELENWDKLVRTGSWCTGAGASAVPPGAACGSRWGTGGTCDRRAPLARPQHRSRSPPPRRAAVARGQPRLPPGRR